MTDHIYRDVILEQHVHLFRGAMGAEFLFMNDNARPLRANIVDECLQSEDITRMDWPAYSPYLNPIDHVWDMLGRRIAARQPPPTCLPELRTALLDEWCNIPQDQIDHLILSMPMRSTPNTFDTEIHNNEIFLFFVSLPTYSINYKHEVFNCNPYRHVLDYRSPVCSQCTCNRSKTSSSSWTSRSSPWSPPSSRTSPPSWSSLPPWTPPSSWTSSLRSGEEKGYSLNAEFQ
ncbi:DDE_3 domain-containing protein [Trichonephila clavipes]|nr:DDE_3 domain-containing protein [Trichonephila clavipes]